MMSNVYEVMLGKPGGHKQLAFGDDLYKPWFWGLWRVYQIPNPQVDRKAGNLQKYLKNLGKTSWFGIWLGITLKVIADC